MSGSLLAGIFMCPMSLDGRQLPDAAISRYRLDGVTSERPLPGLHCNLPYMIICDVFTMRAQRVWSHPTAGAKYDKGRLFVQRDPI
jgi:hypothetical protein